MFVTVLLVLCFLFFVGSCIGWCIEVLFRRIFTAKKWINPGFLTGPYLPLYGFGVAGLYLICQIPLNTGYYWVNALLTIVIMGLTMTLIEYLAGLIFIKGMNVKLWDYSNRWGNIQGIICPLFSVLWTLVGALFYFVIDPFVMEWVKWFVNHLAFAFVVGFFFGVIVIDLCHSVNLTMRIRAFAKERGIVVRLEKLKETVHDKIEKLRRDKAVKKEKMPRRRFLFPFKSPEPLEQSLKEYADECDGGVKETENQTK